MSEKLSQSTIDWLVNQIYAHYEDRLGSGESTDFQIAVLHRDLKLRCSSMLTLHKAVDEVARLVTEIGELTVTVMEVRQDRCIVRIASK